MSTTELTFTVRRLGKSDIKDVKKFAKENQDIFVKGQIDSDELIEAWNSASFGAFDDSKTPKLLGVVAAHMVVDKGNRVVIRTIRGKDVAMVKALALCVIAFVRKGRGAYGHSVSYTTSIVTRADFKIVKTGLEEADFTYYPPEEVGPFPNAKGGVASTPPLSRTKFVWSGVVVADPLVPKYPE